MAKLNFSDDPQAALAIILSADLVKVGEIFPETVGVSEPFEQIRNGKPTTRVIVQPKSRTLLDAELANEVLELLGCDSVEDLDVEDAPAFLAVCRVQGYNTSVSNNIAHEDGAYANFRVGERNRSTLVAGTQEYSQFGLGCQHFDLDVDRTPVCSIATVEKTTMVANRNLNSKTRGKLGDSLDPTKKLQLRTRNLTGAEIKAAIVKAGLAITKKVIAADGTETTVDLTPEELSNLAKSNATAVLKALA